MIRGYFIACIAGAALAGSLSALAQVYPYFPPPGLEYNASTVTLTCDQPNAVLAPCVSAKGAATSAPIIEWIDNASAANNKKWWALASGVFGIYAVDDAGNPGQNGLQINRSGTNITQSSLVAGSKNLSVKNTGDVQVNGSSGTSGQALVSAGSNASAGWGSVAAASVSAAGSAGQIQFNSAGALGATPFVYTLNFGDSYYDLHETNGDNPVLDVGESGIGLTLAGGDWFNDATPSFINLNPGDGASGNGGILQGSGGSAFVSGSGGTALIQGGVGVGAGNSGGSVVLSSGSGTGGAVAGDVNIDTNGATRLSIRHDGDWSLGVGGVGSSHQVLSSNGAGTPPTWLSISLEGATGNLGGSALAAGECVAGTATVTGATGSMVATASPQTDPDSSLSTGIAIYAFVSAADTVTVRVCAIVAVTPSATAYNVRVLR